MKPIVRNMELKLLMETGMDRVMNVFFKYPDQEFSLSDLAKEAGVAKAHIGSMLEVLEKNGIIQITQLTKIWRIRAKRDWAFISNKIVYNLNFIYNSGLVPFLNNHFNNPKAIILFGSFRKGEDITSSDIDIAIESEEQEEYTTLGLRELGEFERDINHKIQIHLFNRRNIDRNLFNSIANGVVLMGFLEVNP